ncbi:DUF6054 family protein [Sporosarcina jiandibaonis]|uniref:DUF6054 family protein n=1 Tax=Sporosarcina jiandibaonis TaxID=2715535 RepID=UPI001557AB57|nr:DUF6054 family protein [Sporosarcina jiandibaonis]
MAVRNFLVNLTPTEAMETIKDWVLGRSVSGTLVDQYERTVDDKIVIVIILEKFYMRTNNRASLTVTIDNFDGETNVRAVAAGTSEGLVMRFDWGAGKNFSNSVENALNPFII